MASLPINSARADDLHFQVPGGQGELTAKLPAVVTIASAEHAKAPQATETTPRADIPLEDLRKRELLRTLGILRHTSQQSKTDHNLIPTAGRLGRAR